jgi:Domain of unknown function (DUF4586)
MSGLAQNKRETLRKEAFQQSKFDPLKSRFGVFSHPGYIATAEDTYAQPLKNRRGPDGKIILGPKNFMVSMSKTQGSCFSIPEYQCDLYQDPPRIYQIEKERSAKMYKNNSSSWKHSGYNKDKFPPYEYMKDPIAQTKNHRESDGTVKTGPKGFFTSPAKRGSSTPGVTIGKMPEHIPDPYESYEDWIRNQQKTQKGKRKYGEFKTVDHGQRQFTHDKELYKSVAPGKGFKEYVYESARHDKPFMHTSPIGFTIGKYPDHLSNAVKEQTPTKKIELPWKHTGYLGSAPTRSVAKLERDNFYLKSN